MLMIVVTVVVIALGGGVVAWYFIYGQKSKISNTKIDNLTASNQVVVNAVDNAQVLISKGDITGAKVVYDNAIKGTTDSYQKTALLSSEATAYINSGDYSQALTAAKELEAVNQNSGVASTIAEIYERQGDAQNAIKYYKKTIELIDTKQPRSDAYIQYIQSKIDVLSGTNG